MAKEILNRVANFLFLEWCEFYDVPELKLHYAELLETAHDALDRLKNDANNQ